MGRRVNQFRLAYARARAKRRYRNGTTCVVPPDRSAAVAFGDIGEPGVTKFRLVYARARCAASGPTRYGVCSTERRQSQMVMGATLSALSQKIEKEFAKKEKMATAAAIYPS